MEVKVACCRALIQGLAVTLYSIGLCGFNDFDT